MHALVVATVAEVHDAHAPFVLGRGANELLMLRDPEWLESMLFVILFGTFEHHCSRSTW